jgi:hypothetical protein
MHQAKQEVLFLKLDIDKAFDSVRMGLSPGGASADGFWHKVEGLGVHSSGILLNNHPSQWILGADGTGTTRGCGGGILCPPCCSS